MQKGCRNLRVHQISRSRLPLGIFFNSKSVTGKPLFGTVRDWESYALLSETRVSSRRIAFSFGAWSDKASDLLPSTT